MKTSRTIAALVILGGMLSPAAADFYSQNFDSMGTGVAAPTGWYMYYIPGGGSSLTAPSGADIATADGGVPELIFWNQTDPPGAWSQQAANMGATSSDPNRLLGTSPTGERGMILDLSLVNSSGAPVNTVSISYDMQFMTAAQTPDELPGYRFYYLDGSTWKPFTSLDLSSPGTAFAQFYYTTPVPSGGTMEFRWFDDNAATPSPDTMIALDNLHVNIPEPATWGLLAMGALVIASRRRKA
jgi:hypothetical protein